MAPIKIEEHFKESLQERGISPSESAWERVVNKLDRHQEEKQNRKQLWMAIAASFVGGLFIASLLIGKFSKPIPKIEVVETSNQEFIEGNKVVSRTEFHFPSDIIESTEDKAIDDIVTNEHTVVVEEHIPTPVTTKIKKVVVQEKNVLPVQENQTTVIAAIDNKHAETAQELSNKTEEKSQLSKLEAGITEKVNDVVAEVNALEAENISVSDAEVEALLIIAQRELLSEKIINQNTNEVDATALLLDIEAELYPESFRNRVFEALKDGYVKTRDALATRNN